MAGRVIRSKEMLIQQEIELKDLFTDKHNIEAKIEKLTKELVSSNVLAFSKTPRDYNEILGILKNFLNRNNYRWVDLMFYALYPVDRFNFHPHVGIKIFVFGEREFILNHIEEIARRIVKGDRWIIEKVGISSLCKLSIEHLLIFEN